MDHNFGVGYWRIGHHYRDRPDYPVLALQVHRLRALERMVERHVLRQRIYRLKTLRGLARIGILALLWSFTSLASI